MFNLLVLAFVTVLKELKFLSPDVTVLMIGRCSRYGKKELIVVTNNFQHIIKKKALCNAVIKGSYRLVLNWQLLVLQ
jgi:hypothetical protein